MNEEGKDSVSYVDGKVILKIKGKTFTFQPNPSKPPDLADWARLLPKEKK